MVKKVFRPFWSYDVEKTEQWISWMAAQGYQFVKINTITRHFFFEEEVPLFEENPPKEVNFRILYDKTQIDKLPNALKSDEWMRVFKHKNWSVIRNDKPTNKIKNFPDREGIVRRNRLMLYVFSGILVYLILSLLPFIFFSALTVFFGVLVPVEESPLWILTLIVGASMWILIPYSTIKLYKSNKNFIKGKTIQINKIYIHRAEKRRLKKTGEIIVKRKFGWNYSPDKLEKWLKEMEVQGYNLTRISKLGIKFYFTKGSSRKVSYCADYQNNLSQNYFDIHQEAGWKLMFTSTSFLTKWSIWSKVYDDSEEPPVLYSDKVHMLKHARRVAITYLSLFGPLIILYLGLVVLNIDLARRNGMDGLSWMTVIIYGIVIIEFGTFVIRSVLYYRRVKKTVQFG